MKENTTLAEAVEKPGYYNDGVTLAQRDRLAQLLREIVLASGVELPDDISDELPAGPDLVALGTRVVERLHDLTKVERVALEVSRANDGLKAALTAKQEWHPEATKFGRGDTLILQPLPREWVVSVSGYNPGSGRYVVELDVAPELLHHLTAQAGAAPEQQPVAEYWVLFDAKADQRYIKKCIEDGTLAFFDNESDAKRARLRNPGTDYKRVAYYTHADDGELERLRVEVEQVRNSTAFQHGYRFGRSSDVREIDRIRQRLSEAQALLRDWRKAANTSDVSTRTTSARQRIYNCIDRTDAFLSASATAQPADGATKP